MVNVKMQKSRGGGEGRQVDGCERRIKVIVKIQKIGGGGGGPVKGWRVGWMDVDSGGWMRTKNLSYCENAKKK